MTMQNLKISKKQINKNGFTLMEVMLSVSILSMGIVASFALISSSMARFSTSANKIIAINLAQDGLERVRNVRDTNWLKGKTDASDWDEKIEGQGAQQFIQFSCVDWADIDYVPPGQANGVTEQDRIDNCDTRCQIYIDNVGGSKCFSDKDNGGALYSNFYRLIHIIRINDQSNSVAVTVKWKDKGTDYYFTTEDILYNWKETN